MNIGSKNGGGFNSTPKNGSQKEERFKKLLNGPMGKKLCEMYARYWQPDAIALHLEEAAQYSRNHKSTISITDSVSCTTVTGYYDTD